MPNQFQAFFNGDSESHMPRLEETSIKMRYSELSTAAPILSAEGLASLHEAFFGLSDRAAGQIRHSDLAWNGLYFAYPSLIAASLKHRFDSFGKIESLKSLGRDAFFDALALHASELYAISPFSVGNRRVIGLHAEQIAHAVGYALSSCDVHKSIWDEALSLAFLHKDHRAIACLFRGTSIPVALFPESLIGPAGLPILPERGVLAERRSYRKSDYRTVDRVRSELEDYIHDAREEATDRLIALTEAAPFSAEQMAAYHELGFLRHRKGPIFQAALLSALNHGVIAAPTHEHQSALEYVREISAGVSAAVSQHSRTSLEFLIETVHVPPYIGGGSPHQDRLAAQFLSNTVEQNLADLRFAPCQRAVDEAMTKSKNIRNADLDRLAARYERICRAVAERIRVGDMMTFNFGQRSDMPLKQVG